MAAEPCDEFEILTNPSDYEPAFLRAPDMDPRTAIAKAAKRLLEVACFRVPGGKVDDTSLKLKNVNLSWPEPSVPMEYPCATIIDYGQMKMEACNLVPTCLEDTFERFGDNTVVWRTCDMVGDMQVDIWSDNEVEREAIAAQLPIIFNQPGVRYGVVVRASSAYFNMPIRLSLVGCQRMDTEATAYIRERRLMVQIRAEIPEVHLRKANVGAYQVVIQQVGESVVVN